MIEVAEYVKQILARHEGLSMRQASLRAGLNQNAIQQIVHEGRVPRPNTLKAIADAWGTEHDYQEMMRLAGYEMPLSPGLKSPREEQLLSLFRRLPKETQDYTIKLLSTLSGHDRELANALRNPEIAPIALRASELDAQGRLAILQLMQYVIGTEGRDDVEKEGEADSETN